MTTKPCGCDDITGACDEHRDQDPCRMANECSAPRIESCYCNAVSHPPCGWCETATEEDWAEFEERRAKEDQRRKIVLRQARPGWLDEGEPSLENLFSKPPDACGNCGHTVWKSESRGFHSVDVCSKCGFEFVPRQV